MLDKYVNFSKQVNAGVLIFSDAKKAYMIKGMNL